jgi:DNA polymerase III subunit epsilon
VFADHIVFVDVETTGSSPQHGRVTEVGVVSLRRGSSGSGSGDSEWQVDEWSSLVNPGQPIPVEIQYLTGITPAMVADAPDFSMLADELLARLGDAVFVAHHARFDYGFLKAEFERCGREFGARTLCTVRLSKLLDPDESPHSLDALILRHRLPVTDRHRALGDARVLLDYLRLMYTQRGAPVVEPAVKLLLKQPSLPAHLPADSLRRVPRGPGVYLFYGLNEHPLYIGKSMHLRERVSSHFVMDYRSERGVRLASETRRIDWVETAGDLGARLLEQTLIRERLPAHNVALRRRQNLLMLAPLTANEPTLRFVKLDLLAPADLTGHYGPFASRSALYRTLTDAAVEHGLCLRTLKIERGEPGSPCFNRQLGKCPGCCVGQAPLAGMIGRLDAALASRRVPAWPFAGAILLREDRAPGEAPRADRTAVPAGDALPGDVAPADTDWHVFDQWCYLGTAGSEAAARQLAAQAPRRFEPDAYRLLHAALADTPAQCRLIEV